MKYLVKKSEMSQYDKNTMDVFGIPSMVLIERAALAATEEIEKEYLMPGNRLLIACGTGNNGADGLVMARLLHLKGYEVQILTVGDRNRATEENKKELSITQAYGVPAIDAENFLHHFDDAKKDADVIIDAIFGVGLSRQIEGVYSELIKCLNSLQGAKVAVDIPSGIDADNGAVLGVAFRADLTVTFSYEKVGMRLFPGQTFCGSIRCHNVGIDDKSFLDEDGKGHKPLTAALTSDDLASIPQRRPHSNKGSYGKVLVIAGSVNMAGAAIFCAKAAYLCGCGLVRVLTPEENRVIVQSALPEAVLTTYDKNKIEDDLIVETLRWPDVIVCGPGLGLSAAAHGLVDMVMEHAAVPVILDADALNIIAENPDMLQNNHTELIVTPHLGEMARLKHLMVPYIKEHIVELAEEFSRMYNLICVLKDARTVTAVPYEMTYINLSGNNGMATGGSGDVLAGVIAGMIAQGLKPELAAPLGVYVHGLAGDVAAEHVGRYSLMAHHLLEALPEIFLMKEGKKQ